MPTRRQHCIANSWLAGVAQRIDDPVTRLRFLRIVSPKVFDGPTRRSFIRSPLLIIPVVAVALAGGLFLRPPAKARPAVTNRRPAGPTVETATRQRLEVWRVDQTKDSETYSNGLWIDDRYSVSNHPRDYLAFPSDPPDGPPSRRSDPAGVVFHTTESSQAEFSEEDNGTLRRIGESLLDYVRRKCAYHFVIDRFGRVHRVVQEGDAANHAGFSVWADERWSYVDLNESFFGVSFEARSDARGGAEISPAQVRAGAMLLEMLRSRYRIPEADCVTHAQVSVNPSNMQAGYHRDWAFGFPFGQLGLPDNYGRDLVSLRAFGFEYANGPSAPDSGVYACAARTEVRMREAAAAAGMSFAAYRVALRERFWRRLNEVRRFRPESADRPS